MVLAQIYHLSKQRHGTRPTGVYCGENQRQPSCSDSMGKGHGGESSAQQGHGRCTSLGGGNGRICFITPHLGLELKSTKEIKLKYCQAHH